MSAKFAPRSRAMLGKVTATMLVSSTISEHTAEAVSKVRRGLTLGLTDMARVLYCEVGCSLSLADAAFVRRAPSLHYL
ncbi:hypothetical protein D3C84_629260 [compost metagenome]